MTLGRASRGRQRDREGDVRSRRRRWERRETERRETREERVRAGDAKERAQRAGGGRGGEARKEESAAGASGGAWRTAGCMVDGREPVLGRGDAARRSEGAETGDAPEKADEGGEGRGESEVEA